jgi:catechol 2,3-dioxygenase-like lactoylglutathione lyase family enzyme
MGALAPGDRVLAHAQRRAIVGLHHTAIVTSHLDRARDFYIGILGLQPHPTKDNWLVTGGSGTIHLLRAPENWTGPSKVPHVAIEVSNLEHARDQLLEAGLTPFQYSLSFETRDVSDRASSLDWGLGTLFISDPDGNTVELVERGRGILAEHRELAG